MTAQHQGPHVTCGLCSLRLLGAKCAHKGSPDGRARPEQCPVKPQRRLVGTCNGCHYWKPRDRYGIGWGACEVVTVQPIDGNSEVMRTPNDFGCIYWETKKP